MIEFSNSLKINETHMVDGPFNEDSKNITFFQGGPNFGVGTAGKCREYMQIGGWSISKENISL